VLFAIVEVPTVNELAFISPVIYEPVEFTEMPLATNDVVLIATKPIVICDELLILFTDELPIKTVDVLIVTFPPTDICPLEPDIVV
jgi:hypothetical protein